MSTTLIPMTTRITDTLLTLGAAARLTRLITTDTLGDWLIVRPAKKWATEREGGYLIGYGVNGSNVLAAPDKVAHEHRATLERAEPDADQGWRSKLVSGLECPFCVGFWITAATLGARELSKTNAKSDKLFAFTAKALTANYVLGHISTRLD